MLLVPLIVSDLGVIIELVAHHAEVEYYNRPIPLLPQRVVVELLVLIPMVPLDGEVLAVILLLVHH